MGKSGLSGEEVGMGANPAQYPLCSGLQALGQTFGANPAFASSLRYLDLSKNPGLLATDESNVSPRIVTSSLGPLPCSPGVEGLSHPFSCNSSVLPLRPSTVSWPSPMPWCTWTWQALTAPLTW